jgi:hypothetical protein
MRWPKSKYGDSYGGWGNTAEEARENQRKVHEEEDAKSDLRMKTYKPEIIDISGDAQYVVVEWTTTDGEHVSAYFKMSSWASPPLSVLVEQQQQWRDWQEKLRHPQTSAMKAAKTPRPARAKGPVRKRRPQTVQAALMHDGYLPSDCEG